MIRNNSPSKTPWINDFLRDLESLELKYQEITSYKLKLPLSKDPEFIRHLKSYFFSVKDVHKLECLLNYIKLHELYMEDLDSTDCTIPGMVKITSSMGVDTYILGSEITLDLGVSNLINLDNEELLNLYLPNDSR
jgi:hypothetical protein